jgi:hypothetical protein
MKFALMKLRLIIPVLLAGLLNVEVSAQQNLQVYTPSILFGKGDWEFKTFQNFYTQTQQFAPDGGKERTNRGREDYITSINQFLYGINGQLNVGFDVWVKKAQAHRPGISRTVISGVGPKIKIAPFRSIERLSIQSTFLFAVSDDLESRDPGAEQPFFFVETDKHLWLTQVFYDWRVSTDFQLFFQQTFWYNLVRDSFRQQNFLQTQTSVFASYFPNQKWTIYAMSEYFPTHYNDTDHSFELSYSYFIQSGIGLKYQLVPNFIELEALYTNF